VCRPPKGPALTTVPYGSQRGTRGALTSLMTRHVTLGTAGGGGQARWQISDPSRALGGHRGVQGSYVGL